MYGQIRVIIGVRTEASIKVRVAFPPAHETRAVSITLTPENSKGVAKLAALIGCAPDELANHLLTETLETFAEEFSGALEGLLGAIYYPDQASAQRALDRHVH
jgi:hypothetical protein